MTHTKYLFTDVPLETLLSWRESAAPIKKTPIHLLYGTLLRDDTLS